MIPQATELARAQAAQREQQIGPAGRAQTWSLFFAQATVHAQAVKQIRADSMLSEEKKSELVAEAVKQTIALLKESREVSGKMYAAGFVAYLADESLDPVRDMDEFKEEFSNSPESTE